MNYAYVKNGEVLKVYESRVHLGEGIRANLHECPEEVDDTYTFDGNTFTQDPAKVKEKEDEADIKFLDETDKPTARLAEDLLALLLAKGVIVESDIRDAALARINKRKAARARLGDN